jgi:hypothetical protein
MISEDPLDKLHSGDINEAGFISGWTESVPALMGDWVTIQGETI